MAAVGVEVLRAGAGPHAQADWGGSQAESARGGRVGVACIDARVPKDERRNGGYGRIALLAVGWRCVTAVGYLLRHRAM